MQTGRKIREVNLSSEVLVQCNFRTSPLTKHKLINTAKDEGITISEVVNDIVTHYHAHEDVKEYYNEKVRKLVIQLGKGDSNKMAEMLELWKKI